MHSPNKPTKLPFFQRFTFYSIFIRPIFFRFDSESIHQFVVSLGSLIWKTHVGRMLTQVLYGRHAAAPKATKNSLAKTNLAGILLSNPIGLAAGFDKNAELLDGIHTIGFGFVEIGTITPRAQLGNPKPRLKRIPEQRALLNKMGFNNDGDEVIAHRIRSLQGQIKIPLGVNIGKNKDTPNSEAAKDYEMLFQAFRQMAQYFTINISSPNTPGLRDLQTANFLGELGDRIKHQQITQPVFVKLAPEFATDHSSADLKSIYALCGPSKPFAGLVLTNTISTDLGGLSGYPLKNHSLKALQNARTVLDKSVPIISVGGIETVEDIVTRLEAGATAIQLYSALIYQGPGLVSKLVRQLGKIRK